MCQRVCALQRCEGHTGTPGLHETSDRVLIRWILHLGKTQATWHVHRCSGRLLCCSGRVIQLGSLPRRWRTQLQRMSSDLCIRRCALFQGIMSACVFYLLQQLSEFVYKTFSKRRRTCARLVLRVRVARHRKPRFDLFHACVFHSWEIEFGMHELLHPLCISEVSLHCFICFFFFCFHRFLVQFFPPLDDGGHVFLVIFEHFSEVS
mmetsp:Transcript_7051/g.43300  ORF Transcript_7051/g.43300 Transcript_7051/m.43300 type:complete len:206 (-) Transcript_7051:743-1360(-)